MEVLYVFYLTCQIYNVREALIEKVHLINRQVMRHLEYFYGIFLDVFLSKKSNPRGGRIRPTVGFYAKRNERR